MYFRKTDQALKWSQLWQGLTSCCLRGGPCTAAAERRRTLHPLLHRARSPRNWPRVGAGISRAWSGTEVTRGGSDGGGGSAVPLRPWTAACRRSASGRSSAASSWRSRYGRRQRGQRGRGLGRAVCGQGPGGPRRDCVFPLYSWGPRTRTASAPCSTARMSSGRSRRPGRPAGRCRSGVAVQNRGLHRSTGPGNARGNCTRGKKIQ